MGRGQRERGEVIYGWGTRVTVWLGSRSATPTRARGGEGRETESTEAAGRKGIGLRSAGARWFCGGSCLGHQGTESSLGTDRITKCLPLFFSPGKKRKEFQSSDREPPHENSLLLFLRKHMRIPFVLQPELFMNHVTPSRSVFLVVVTLEEFMTRCKLVIGDRLGIKSNTFLSL